MKNRFWLFLLSSLIFSGAAYAQSGSDDGDIQFWSDVSVSVPLKKERDGNGKEFERLTLFFSGTFRAGDNFTRPTDERVGFGFNYKVNNNVSFSPDYVYRGSQQVKGRNDYEHRIRFAVTLENKWKRFSIADRNQIEYRARHNRKDDVRYKNRFRFNVPILKNGKELFTAFASTEPYYNFQSKKFTRNEFFTGVSKKFTGAFAADFYYLLVHDISAPKTVNGVGVNLKFKVD